MPLVQYAIGTQPDQGWPLLAPVSAERASYGPLLFLLGISGVVLVTNRG